MRFPWRVIGVVLLAASLATAFSTSLAHQLEAARGVHPVIWRLALLNATFWFGWVLLAVPIVLLSQVLRIDRRPRIAVPVHVATILAASFVHIGLQTVAQTYVYVDAKSDVFAEGGFAEEWVRIYAFELQRLIDWELITGAAILAMAHAYFYYRESQQRSLEAAQLQTRLVEAQLSALQSQLHPHFLFNTLHAISVLMHRDVRAADRMLVQLSDLLRMTLDTVSNPEIQLHEEVDFLAKYLEIEQVRLGDRLTVEFSVDEGVLDAVVPALVLQPLVENAIKHGIAPHGRPGRVSINARQEGDLLVMTVFDTGPGPSERAMAALSTGIGVSNTRARLTHQFGSRFRFEFQRHREGFTVLVVIPVKRDPAEPAQVEDVVWINQGEGHVRETNTGTDRR